MHQHDQDHTHEHGEGCGHDHTHGHAPPVDADNQRRVFWAMLITGGFMTVEVAGGLISGSLALLADAGHMLTDTASLALAWFAFQLGRKPADKARSYGYQRFQVLAAFVNGATLLAIVGWIAVEAVGRLLNPQPVMGSAMMGVAILGLVVNLVAFRLLHGGDQHNLNLRGAALHVLGDLLGSVAAIAAAIVILTTGWTPIDPLLSLLVAALILRSAWMLVRQSSHILLEGTPGHLDIEEIKRELPAAVPGISDVHHVHAWSLTAERPLVTLHANVHEGADHGRVLQAIKTHLAERFSVEHSTVQLEAGPCADHEREHVCGAEMNVAGKS
ncbi:cation diffusion facilitator family transporter [Rhodovibrio salinarum]|uniref:Cation transporter n=1 Tax=Rhodovibrio salinarum TaxID=1087 RepID=A0A934QIP8_9PROT|nr:cation diffusion facilitator family transporter [Rhodovibrio salinarum]MBK1697170.1 cation transporter [Rhodovibrio salinarum]